MCDPFYSISNPQLVDAMIGFLSFAIFCIQFVAYYQDLTNTFYTYKHFIISNTKQLNIPLNDRNSRKFSFLWLNFVSKYLMRQMFYLCSFATIFIYFFAMIFVQLNYNKYNYWN